jgi:hypothetical protein
MQRWETLFLLSSVALASLSIVPIAGHSRPVLALAAIAIVGLIGLLRVRRAMTKPRAKPRSLDAYDRAMRIQEMRDQKYRR